MIWRIRNTRWRVVDRRVSSAFLWALAILLGSAGAVTAEIVVLPGSETKTVKAVSLASDGTRLIAWYCRWNASTPELDEGVAKEWTGSAWTQIYSGELQCHNPSAAVKGDGVLLVSSDDTGDLVWRSNVDAPPEWRGKMVYDTTGASKAAFVFGAPYVSYRQNGATPAMRNAVDCLDASGGISVCLGLPFDYLDEMYGPPLIAGDNNALYVLATKTFEPSPYSYGLCVKKLTKSSEEFLGDCFYAEDVHDARSGILALLSGLPAVAWTELDGGSLYVARWGGVSWRVIKRVDLPADRKVYAYRIEGSGDSLYLVYQLREASNATPLQAVTVERWDGLAWSALSDPVPALEPGTADVWLRGLAVFQGHPHLAFLVGSQLKVARIQPATVSVTASDATATEAGLTTGTFRFTRSGSTTDTLTVHYTVGGSATPSADYAPIGESVTFPVGAGVVTKAVTPAQDSLPEGAETVIVTLSPDAGYVVGSPSSATVTLTSDDPVLPILTVTATRPTVTEAGLAAGKLTFTRTGSTAGALSVYYSVGGTATAGLDYVSLGSSVVFPVGASAVSKMVTPLQDNLQEVPETIVVTLLARSTYALGSPGSTTLTLTSDESVTQTVTVSAYDASATEANLTTGRFRLTRVGNSGVPLTVYFTHGGSATPGSDYVALPSSLTFLAGQTVRDLTVVPVNDATIEAAESVTLKLTPHSTYAVGNPGTATITLVSDEKPVVTVTAYDAVAGENPLNVGRFRLTRTGASSAPLTVYYSVGGSATAGSDYQSLGTSRTFNSGQTVLDITVTPVNDAVIETPETVILTLATNSAYVLGTAKIASVTLASDEKPVVTVTATDASAGESPANMGTFRIARTGATNAPLQVFYTRSGTATAGGDYLNNFSATGVTIPAGQSSISISVTPINDAAAEAPETVVLTLSANAAYVIGAEKTAAVTIASEDVALPNVRGTYVGTGSQTLRQCQDASSNITVSFNATIRITGQTGSAFTGNGILTATVGGTAYASTLSSLRGTVNAAGQLSSGAYDFVTTEGGSFDSSGTGTFSGTLVGDRLIVSFVSRDQVGDTCVITGSLTATR